MLPALAARLMASRTVGTAIKGGTKLANMATKVKGKWDNSLVGRLSSKMQLGSRLGSAMFGDGSIEKRDPEFEKEKTRKPLDVPDDNTPEPSESSKKAIPEKSEQPLAPKLSTEGTKVEAAAKDTTQGTDQIQTKIFKRLTEIKGILTTSAAATLKSTNGLSKSILAWGKGRKPMAPGSKVAFKKASIGPLPTFQAAPEPFERTDALAPKEEATEKAGASGGGVGSLLGDLFSKMPGKGMKGPGMLGRLATVGGMGTMAAGAAAATGLAGAGQALIGEDGVLRGGSGNNFINDGVNSLTGADEDKSKTIGSRVYDMLHGNKEKEEAAKFEKTMNDARLAKRAKNQEHFRESLEKQGITDPNSVAAAMGNIAKESNFENRAENLAGYKNTSNERIREVFGSSMGKKTDEEIDALKADPEKFGEAVYGAGSDAGKRLGNTEEGDGYKYRGRGMIQLTGRSNYEQASKDLFGDNRLADDPDMILKDPKLAADVSAWHLKKNKDKMAEKLGIDQTNMTPEQADKLMTATVAGKDLSRTAIGQEHLSKVSDYSAKYAMGNTAEQKYLGAQSPHETQLAKLEKEGSDEQQKNAIVENATLEDSKQSSTPTVIAMPSQAPNPIPVNNAAIQQGGVAMHPRNTDTSIRRLTDAQMGLSWA